jgi:AbiU2
MPHQRRVRIDCHPRWAPKRFQLSSQIPTSHAANAFIVFRNGLHQFEIVRLCALWDSAELEKENIPTLVELIDHPDVIETLAREAQAYRANQSVGHILNEPDDPDLRELVVETLRLDNIKQGEIEAERVRTDLRQAISDSRATLASSKHESIMNIRDKHLAHSLTETRRERKIGTIAPMKYGDERDILNATLPVMEKLLRGIAGKGFDFENSRRIDRDNAQALWGACAFKIER